LELIDCNKVVAMLRKEFSFIFLNFLLLFESLFAMRLVVQKVKSASVTVDGWVVSSIGPGAMALVGLHEHDTKEDLEYCCKRLLACKLWENDNGALWRRGVKQRDLELLCVSQFTLYGTLTKKNQPDYKRAMKSEPAREMYIKFLEMLKKNYKEDKIEDGVFGAMMDVALVNDGPVTIVIESNPKAPEEQDDEES
jgi:D-tyrosyl-tRNA(Tyr) deacylase